MFVVKKNSIKIFKTRFEISFRNWSTDIVLFLRYQYCTIGAYAYSSVQRPLKRPVSEVKGQIRNLNEKLTQKQIYTRISH